MRLCLYEKSKQKYKLVYKESVVIREEKQYWNPYSVHIFVFKFPWVQRKCCSKCQPVSLFIMIFQTNVLLINMSNIIHQNLKFSVTCSKNKTQKLNLLKINWNDFEKIVFKFPNKTFTKNIGLLIISKKLLWTKKTDFS